MKAVLDTNVYVSGLLFPAGIPARLVALAREGRYELYFSPEILDELRRVLRDKFDLTAAECEKLLRWTDGCGKIVYPERTLNLVRSCPGDNRILECALDAGVRWLVTGDKKHLLPLRHNLPFAIVTPADFYRRLTGGR